MGGFMSLSKEEMEFFVERFGRIEERFERINEELKSICGRLSVNEENVRYLGQKMDEGFERVYEELAKHDARHENDLVDYARENDERVRGLEGRVKRLDKARAVA
jgi:predicted nuclease with TOPRIM domain